MFYKSKHNVFLNYFPEQHNIDTEMSPGSHLDNFIKKHIPAGQLLHQIPGDRVVHPGGESAGLLAELCAQPNAKLLSKQGHVPQFPHL